MASCGLIAVCSAALGAAAARATLRPPSVNSADSVRDLRALQELLKVMDEADDIYRGHGGKPVSREQFQKELMSHPPSTSDTVDLLYKVFDDNADGSLSADEFREKELTEKGGGKE